MTDVNSLVPESIRDEIANCMHMRDESDRVKFLNMLPAPAGALWAAEGIYLRDDKAISFSGVVERDGYLVLHHWEHIGKPYEPATYKPNFFKRFISRISDFFGVSRD